MSRAAALRGSRSVPWAVILIFAALFGLLFQYRILALLKRLGWEVVPFGSKFDLALAPEQASIWVRPFLYAAEYLNEVWFNTLLGVLIAGAVAAFLPRLIGRWLGGSGLRQAFGGALFGIPNMLCSCCAAAATDGVRRAGAGMSATLAFFVAAPSLNIVVFVLALNKLPLSLALTRLILGFVGAVLVAHLVARWATSRSPAAAHQPWAEDDGRGFLAQWLSHSWRTAVMVLPVLFLGFLLVGALKTAVPVETIAKGAGDGFLSTALAALIGSTIMVPTGAEVLWLSEALPKGMAIGPAVALLICLPAVSVPSLWALGRSLGSYRAPLGLFLGIFALGTAAGVAATWIA